MANPWYNLPGEDQWLPGRSNTPFLLPLPVAVTITIFIICRGIEQSEISLCTHVYTLVDCAFATVIPSTSTPNYN
ncbi:hypothetical protein Patl1_19814 [Pistacia atlantica]|uniref:Uncharacterized protein n=1 Tax=Pistacia atlantica TaxID=434234 RepID=A0ACC1BJG2_9ROSI|nr:hypothetical protein Patl1_19814 [Pistacia atlantica]